MSAGTFDGSLAADGGRWWMAVEVAGAGRRVGATTAALKDTWRFCTDGPYEYGWTAAEADPYVPRLVKPGGVLREEIDLKTGRTALGSFGVSAGFSFNFYKNITSGEGGAFVTNQKKVFDRGSVAVDCCAFYWDEGPQQDDVQFAGGNYRINEISGAILNVQLSRLDPMLKRMRRNKKRLLSVGLRAGLRSIVNNSLDHECGTNLGFIFDTEREARDFAAGLKKKKVGAFLPIDTGRHFYTRWEPIIRKQGAHHPALDPFRLKENRGSRVDYSEKLCERSLDIVQRAVLLPMNPDHTQKDRDRIAAAIRAAG